MELEIKPLSPDEVAQTVIAHPGIIKVVNELLRLRYRTGGTATILQKDIMSAFLAENEGYTKEQVYEEKLMDFEAAFERVGWNVSYDKAGYNEAHYEPSFKFSKRK